MQSVLVKLILDGGNFIIFEVAEAEGNRLVTQFAGSGPSMPPRLGSHNVTTLGAFLPWCVDTAKLVGVHFVPKEALAQPRGWNQSGVN
jgi:hypothetical protein